MNINALGKQRQMPQTGDTIIYRPACGISNRTSYENEVRSAEARMSVLRIAIFSCPSCDADRTTIPERAGATSRLSAHAHIVIQLASDSLNRLGELAKAPTGVLARPWSGSHPWAVASTARRAANAD
ncbi:hypothetical protein CPLU01_08579 [Colletotrichum plurivorum]|uniref:Uncharacterized protein n=1 Tax=Colletotrichum plurivorum TaxID=2175906 RepID=A0A8H6NCJ1_9PEZI|nr:hypothetical protein CPLU01_08579 [Colletotrichum plurivorum]